MNTGLVKGQCMMCCMELVPVRYIDLYVIGSEGLRICHFCEMNLVEHVRNVMEVSSRAMRSSMIQAKEERDASKPAKQA